MIINHHFRVEIKAHNFNLSSVNKRFLPPVISISPVTFFISNRLRSLSADSRNARPSGIKPLYHLKLLCAFTTVKTSLQWWGKNFFHVKESPFIIIRGGERLLPTIKTDEPSCHLTWVCQRVLSRPCLLGPLLEKLLKTSRWARQFRKDWSPGSVSVEAAGLDRPSPIFQRRMT